MAGEQSFDEMRKTSVYTKYNVRITGSGSRTIVFAHGLGLDQTIWRLVAPEFESDFTVVLFDYVGSGFAEKISENTHKYNTLEGFADDLSDLCDQLELKDVIFVGHSISSMIGLIAALKQPDCYKQFVFVNPSPRYLDDVDGYVGGYRKSDIDQIIKQIEHDYIGWIKSVVPSFVNENNSAELVEEVVSLFMANDKDRLKQFALATFFIDYRKALLEFKKPCLIIQGANDVVVPVHVGDYLHAHLAESKLVTLKGRGHFPQLTSPEEVIDAIRAFITNKQQ